MNRVFKTLQQFIDSPGTRNIAIASGVMVGIFLVGMTGYHFLEGMKWFDGLYMTFITISTIGFTELKTLSVEGRLFTMGIFVFGIGVISYIASQTTQLLFESELFHRRAMRKKLDKMDDHYIICGYGRIGSRIAQVLSEAGLPVVVVEKQANSIEQLKDSALAYIEGNAEEEEVLMEAGIKKAKALICTLSSDQDNVFTTLLARELNSNLYILVRTNEKRNRNRLIRAGANKVISPYEIGADRMANVILRPNVEQFIQSMTRDKNQEHTFEEVLIQEESELAGRSLSEIDVRKKYAVLIIAIIPEGKRIIFNPSSSDTVNAGDSLILMGDLNDINKFREEICNDTRSPAERTKKFNEVDAQ